MLTIVTILLDLHCARSLMRVPRGIHGDEFKNHEENRPKILWKLHGILKANSGQSPQRSASFTPPLMAGILLKTGDILSGRG